MSLLSGSRGRAMLLQALVLSLVISPFSSLADEGMWLPGSIDAAMAGKLKTRGLQLTPEEIYSTSKVSLKDAIVQLSIGCTASFVSPEGLIVTNHHCAFEGVAKNSSVDADYITSGFLAKTRGEELPLKGYNASVTQEYRDVTDEVMSAVKPEMTPQERDRALNAKRGEIQKAALGDRGKEGYRTQIVEANGGSHFYLYVYFTVRDVRLVYAPPKNIGFYGGDPDNFEWPRHTGDFAFLRAYAGKDGKPADFSKDNVPFQPKKFLPLSATGVKEGDYTMIMGYPGSTFRKRESYSVEFRGKSQLPEQIAGLKKQIAFLTGQGEKDPAMKIKNADTIFSLANSLKAFQGAVIGIRRANLVERKRAEEAAFVKWLDGNPQAKAKYGNVLPQIGELYGDLGSFNTKQNVLNEISQSSDLLQVLGIIYNVAENAEKPANERNPQFAPQLLERIKAQLAQVWPQRNALEETEKLTEALESAASLQFPYIESLFAGKTGADRRKAEAEFARQAVGNSKYASLEELTKLMSASAADLRANDDPALKLVIPMNRDQADFNRRLQRFNSEVAKLRPSYVRGMLDFRKDAYYPDANFTLRFTYGEVKSYKPRDAVYYHWQTSLTGVLDKDTGEEPFDAPAKLKQLAAAKDFGTYLDAKLGDVPVNFLSTNDITGGNSGSPVMNGRGEIIGLAFDGNFEGLGGDYVFEPALNRTLCVDIRYVLFLTEKLAGASHIINELTINRGKAVKAKGAAAGE
ncbi:MAG: S46 family peptidase [Blastocatellia bacterium]